MSLPGGGELLVILVASLITFQNVFAKRIMEDTTTGMVICSRICISAVLIIATVPFMGGRACMEAMVEAPIVVILSGVLYFPSVFCQYRAIKLVGPFVTTSMFLMGSLVSALIAFLVLGESLLAVQWPGVAGTLIGGYLLVKGYTEKDSPHGTLHT